MKHLLITSLLVAFLTCGLTSNQHLICKTVRDVFSEAVDDRRGGINETVVGHSQGKPGKRGPIGPRGLLGPRGLKGDAGYVDYNNISEIVEGKVCEGLTAVLSRLNAIQEALSDFQRNQNEMLRCDVSKNLLYNGTCYSYPEYSISRGHLNRGEAKQACQNMGYKLAKIRDRTQQEALENFVQPRVPSGERYFWIDLTYDIATKSLQYESGGNIPDSQITWYPGYPLFDSGRQYIMLAVKESGNDGIFNHPDFDAHGVICEKKM